MRSNWARACLSTMYHGPLQRKLDIAQNEATATSPETTTLYRGLTGYLALNEAAGGSPRTTGYALR